MARVKNTMSIIEKSVGCIEARYGMCINNIQEIKDSSNDDFDLICNGFRFGYIQGMKAARAQMNG